MTHWQIANATFGRFPQRHCGPQLRQGFCLGSFAVAPRLLPVLTMLEGWKSAVPALRDPVAHGDCHDETSTGSSSLRVFAGAVALAAGARAGAGHARRFGRQRDRIQPRLLRGQGEDSRVDEDVLLANLSRATPLAFEIDDFNGRDLRRRMADRDQRLPRGRRRRRLLPEDRAQRLRAKFVDDERHRDRQDLKLRIVPLTATVRFLPIGRARPSAVRRRRHRGVSTGATAKSASSSTSTRVFRPIGSSTGRHCRGPVVLGGVRFPIGDALTVGGEFAIRRPRATRTPRRVPRRQDRSRRLDALSFTFHSGSERRHLPESGASG